MTATLPLDMELRADDGPIFTAVYAEHTAAALAAWYADHCLACERAVEKRADGTPVRHKDRPGGEWCGGVA